MEAYVRLFQGTGMSVFSPITPLVPSWVGDIPTFAEWARWFGNKPAGDVADMLNDDSWRGHLGYVFMIIDVGMDALLNMSHLLQPHVQLVGYRELIDLAHQRKGRAHGHASLFEMERLSSLE